MTNKLAGVLHKDTLARGIDVSTIELKRNQLKKQMCNLDFMNYLKNACHERQDVQVRRKIINKSLAQCKFRSHQHLILTMRTQYEARPNS